MNHTAESRTRFAICPTLGLIVIVLLSIGVGCSPDAARLGDRDSKDEIYDRDQNFETLAERLRDYRVVFVGETHDNYAHHLDQLALLRALYQLNGDKMAVGMEAFQQPFQVDIDAYLSGEIDLNAMLRRTEYFERWRYDYRLYSDIIEFLRENQIPLIALNASREITDRVSDVGIDGLSVEERQALPDTIDYSDTDYEDRLRAVFESHGEFSSGSFERFLDVQLSWDESMAQRAYDYLAQHPDRQLVVIAGGQHLAYGSGIPNRVERRLGEPGAIVLHQSGSGASPESADFVLDSAPAALPKAGLMGIFFDATDSPLVVSAFTANSAAEAVGVKVGDRIAAVNTRTVRQFTDIKLELWNKKPGDAVDLTVLSSNNEESTYRVVLR